MFDDLAAYYHENVVAAFLDYQNRSRDKLAGRSRDLRSALIAASALFHLREHLPKSAALSRTDVERACPDYGLLGDIANTAKHKVVTNSTPHGPPLVNDAINLSEQIVITEYKDEAGPFRNAQKTVVVKLIDGSERNVLEILTNVINFWERHLHSLGVLSEARVFKRDGDERPRSRAECEPNRLDFEMIQNQRFRQTLRLLRFDYETGKATPIDLTGTEVKARVYRPNYDIELGLRHDATGKEFRTIVPLTEEESLLLSSMSSDTERQKYIQALPAVQAGLRQLAAEAGLPRLPGDSGSPGGGGRGGGAPGG